MVIAEIGWAITGGIGPAVDNFLNSLPKQPRLLGLGEPTHGLETFPRLRNQIFQHLVEHHGYRAIALESDCMAGLVANAYLVDGKGTLDDALRDGFSHFFGQSEANWDLLRWMRAYNENHPEDPVRVFGFDGPLEMTHAESPRQALTALNDYLGSPYEVAELLGDDARWTHPDAIMNPAKSVGSSDDAVRLRLITDDLVQQLAAQSPRLVAETSRDAWWLARLYARTAVGLLRYHAELAQSRPTRVANCGGIRDAMMADNLKGITEYGRTLVFAHNQHLRRGPIRMDLAGAVQTWWSAGAIVGAELGDEYGVLVTGVGAMPEMAVDAPEPETMEGFLLTLQSDHFIVNSHDAVAALADREFATRASDYRWYPLDLPVIQDADGLMFVRQTDGPPSSWSAAPADSPADSP